MAIITEVRRLYTALIESGAVRYGVYPAGAADVVLTAGAGAYAWPANYTQIVAAVGQASWMYGVHFNDAAVDDFEVRIGSGLAAAEVALILLPFNGNDRSGGFINVPFPCLVANGIRVSGGSRSGTGGNDIDVKVAYASAI